MSNPRDLRPILKAAGLTMRDLSRRSKVNYVTVLHTIWGVNPNVKRTTVQALVKGSKGVLTFEDFFRDKEKRRAQRGASVET